jgi:hypothetical protein
MSARDLALVDVVCDLQGFCRVHRRLRAPEGSRSRSECMLVRDIPKQNWAYPADLAMDRDSAAPAGSLRTL